MSEQPPQDPRQPPPGWYADPGNGQVLRWWDGAGWAAQTQPVPGFAATPQLPPPGEQYGPAGTPGHRTWKSWPARHKAPAVIFGAAGLIVLLAIIGAATGAGSKNESAAQNAASASAVSELRPESQAEAALQSAAADLTSDDTAAESNLPPACVPGLRRNYGQALTDYSKAAADADNAVSEMSSGSSISASRSRSSRSSTRPG